MVQQICTLAGFVVDPISKKIALALKGLKQQTTNNKDFAPGPFGEFAAGGTKEKDEFSFVFPSPRCRADFMKLRPGDRLLVTVGDPPKERVPYEKHLHGLRRGECRLLLTLAPAPPASRTGP